MRILRHATLVSLVLVVAPHRAFAQEPVGQAPTVQQTEQEKPPAKKRRSTQELKISTVAVSSTYMSQTIPDNVTNFRDPTFLGAAQMWTAATEIDWMRSSSGAHMNVQYAPQYAMTTGASTLKDFNQSLTGTIASNSKTSKWKLAVSGSGQIMSFDEALFSSPILTSVASSGSKVGDVASAMLTGAPTDPALSSADGFKPDPALERIFFGRRTAFAGGSASISYAPSSRLSFGTTVGAMHTKHLDDATDVSGLLYPEFTSESVGMNVTYSLARRTQIGVGADIAQTKSSILDNTGATGRFFVSHTMRRWFAQASVGAGSTSASAGEPRTITYSGGLGFNLTNQTFMVGFYRDITDAYIIALGPTSSYFTSATGAWHWGGLRSVWQLDGSFTHLRDAPPGQPAPNTWNAQATVARQLGRQFGLHFQYGVGRMGSRRYIQDGRQYQMSQNAVRASFSWYPGGKPAAHR
jgi:hypothetical protein